MACLCASASAHLAKPNAMPKSLALENPFIPVLVDAEKAGGEDGATALEQPADFVCFSSERTVVRFDDERVDATALERVLNVHRLDARKTRDVCFRFFCVYLE